MAAANESLSRICLFSTSGKKKIKDNCHRNIFLNVALFEKKRIDKKALKLKSLLFSLLCIIYLVTPVGLVGFWEIRYQHLEFNVSCLKVLDKICKLYIQVLFKIKRSASGVDFNLYTSTA